MRSSNKFELLFKTYFEVLVSFALKFTQGDFNDAKELVHKVFIKVWEKYDTLPEDTNFKSYLYTSVNNLGLNYIRDRKKFVDLQHATTVREETSLEVQELERNIELGLNLLPEKCREIFELSRFEGLKYQEIADRLGISIKTVEAQMSKALRVLKEHLKEFLVILWIILVSQSG